VVNQAHIFARLHGPNGSRIEEEHITADELAAMFGLTPRTVKRYAREELWSHVRPPGRSRTYLFCSHDVDEIVASLAHRGRQV
jgi:hypothetical protein